MSSSAMNRVERRHHPREVIGGDYALQVDIGSGHPVKCFIWDISEGGARLTLTEKIVSLPDKMIALIGNVARPLRLVWQKDEQIGIEFLATDEATCSDDPLVA